MEVVLIAFAVIILVAGWFMVKAFVRLGTAMTQMRDSLNELGEMAPRLQRLGEDMTALNQALEQRARRAGNPEPPA